MTWTALAELVSLLAIGAVSALVIDHECELQRRRRQASRRLRDAAHRRSRAS